jgi:Putative Ig domain
MVATMKALTGSYARVALVGVLVLIGVLVATSIAQAAVSISRAELSGTQLRIEGHASPNRTITVDGVAMGTSDGSGRFRIERSGFTAPADCTVDVNDGSASAATARLSGCTVSSTSPPPPSNPPPSTCTIVPETFADGNVGTLNTWFFPTTGCRTSEKPVQFTVVSGQIPPGLKLFTQGVASGGITGTPTTRGTFSFVVRATDTRGAFAERTFSITVS